ncbi:hypothetical protein [Sutcliffiella horikoshii]|uniref:hypothetical protein n=1 Tax=Sutcliffiella horikoshii TaxID=79883 RepID=UPI001CFCD4DE|nr:hypothetical protein [Sutcliffiella horikoshii]
MNKLWITILLAGMLILTACSSNSDSEAVSEGNSSTEATNPDTSDSEAASVDKGLFNVEVTIPASMFEGEDLDAVIVEAEKEGMKAAKNEDGSVTYKMSKSKHKEMLAEIKQSIVDSIEEMKTSGEFVSIKDITHNNSFTEFTMVVDKTTYENSMDGFASFALGIGGMMYQMYDGVDPDKYKVNILIQDEETNEVFDEILFPDDMNE